MFPAAFDYLAPPTLDEALATLGQRGEDAKVLAGGQSLIPLMKLRLAAPSLVVDLGRIDDLVFMSSDGSILRIGARVRHCDIEASPELRRDCPILHDAVRLISDPLVRNMGTAAGSVCHADPAGDWGAVMLALQASFVLRSRGGERSVEAVDFFTGPYSTVMRPDEVMTEIRIRVPQRRSGGSYQKLERKIGDFATVGVAVQVELDNGHISRAGIGLTAVGPTNLRAEAAERALAGAPPDDALIAEAARLAAAASEPRSDIRGSAEYKRDVVRVFVQRGLRAALRKAQEVQA
ncbi:MAG TPA: xanthine dehydrogenase family protein subunit M [Candidatus Dormibacteraeota bacterium]|nr:xanthine dehydrogenase family protein subunit M [Candidatus Dormibacteraeota bacterium]